MESYALDLIASCCASPSRYLNSNKQDLDLRDRVLENRVAAKLYNAAQCGKTPCQNVQEAIEAHRAETGATDADIAQRLKACGPAKACIATVEEYEARAAKKDAAHADMLLEDYNTYSCKWTLAATSSTTTTTTTTTVYEFCVGSHPACQRAKADKEKCAKESTLHSCAWAAKGIDDGACGGQEVSQCGSAETYSNPQRCDAYGCTWTATGMPAGECSGMDAKCYDFRKYKTGCTNLPPKQIGGTLQTCVWSPMNETHVGGVASTEHMVINATHARYTPPLMCGIATCLATFSSPKGISYCDVPPPPAAAHAYINVYNFCKW